MPTRSLIHTFLFSAAILLTGWCLPASAQAQDSPKASFRESFSRSLNDAEKKLVALAEATPAEKYSWRPGEGVRSISEVFMHVADDNYGIAEALTGGKRPATVPAELEKITDKAKVIETLKNSFEYVRQSAASFPEANLDQSNKAWRITNRDIFFILATHAHEHLGQSIAYARMNGIVPPWSRPAPKK